MIITIAGPDGCGKSRAAELVMEMFDCTEPPALIPYHIRLERVESETTLAARAWEAEDQINRLLILIEETA